MSVDALDRKVRQMHDALGTLRTEDLSSLLIETRANYIGMNFSQGTTFEGLANIASGMIANIACLKDHLKVWCKKNAKRHNCQNLINTNKDVAIIHDLWNIDKHGELNRPSRSGAHPRLRNLSRGRRLQADPGPGSAKFILPFATGKPAIVNTEGGGSVSLSISSEIVDEHGNVLGDFITVCERATSAWEQELRQVGVRPLLHSRASDTAPDGPECVREPI